MHSHRTLLQLLAHAAVRLPTPVHVLELVCLGQCLYLRKGRTLRVRCRVGWSGSTCLQFIQRNRKGGRHLWLGWLAGQCLSGTVACMVGADM
jgi:hypothetical protein